MILALFIIICLFFVLLLRNYRMSVKASSNIIYVPDNYTKIQWAIGNASDGDTIYVRSGIYYENIFINKSITLVGEHRDSTIINGSKTGYVVAIEANNVSIQNFTITKSGDLPYSGILIKSSMGNVITNNRIIENSYGIQLFLSSNNNISGNLISNNVYDGIYLLTSFSNFISCNVVLSNGLSGISLYNSGGNIVYDNTISNNRFYGIFFYSSIGNVISVNNIINNPSGGIVTFFSSNNNIIYHNNLNNIVQVYSENSMNFWSYNNEGNYWSNYFGEDSNQDGIGDVPYVIDGNNSDDSPLMGMFSKFDITCKGEVHQVTIISNSTISDFQFQVGSETGNKIIHFKPIGNASTAGFCRVMIPVGFMSYPYILLLGNEEFSPSFLNVSNETHVYLYFTYLHKNQTVTIISSEWYNELLNIYYDLNVTYHNLLNLYYGLLYNYTVLLDNYTLLRGNFEQLNASYQYFYDLNETFYDFLHDYSRLQENFNYLNETYYDLADLYWQLQINFGNLSITYQNLLNAFVLLSGNYTRLQEDFQVLNASYQEHLRNYSENVSNVKNLTYILAAGAAILIIVTAYLSKRTYGSGAQKIKRFGEE